jgi:hypothetical protein
VNRFATILSPADIAAQHALTMRLDPAFARTSLAWWQGRTESQLRSLRSGAWFANDGETFQLASSYLAIMGVEP